MLLLDEFPLTSLLNSLGQVDERVYPNFAKLAQSSNWYRNATSIDGLTQYAVPSMLTGRYPEEKLAPSYVAHPDNLFSLLAPDYRIRPFETITQLCDPAVCEKTEPPNSDSGGLRGLLGQTWDVAKVLAKPYDERRPARSSSRRSRPPPRRPPKKSAGRTDGAEVVDARGQPAGPVQAVPRGADSERQADDELPAPAAAALVLALPAVRATYPDKLLGAQGLGGRTSWPMDVDHQASCCSWPTPTGCSAS